MDNIFYVYECLPLGIYVDLMHTLAEARKEHQIP